MSILDVSEDSIMILEGEFDDLSIKPYKTVLSIDIGITHLGLSLCSITDDFDIHEVLYIDLIDITKFHCEKDCEWNHSRNIADWLTHLFSNEYDLFNNADHILIERQPLSGLKAVEQIIFMVLRDKAELISPNSVHKMFHLPRGDYDGRKVICESIVRKFLNSQQLSIFESHERKHDIADSILFTYFWCKKKKIRKQAEERKKKLHDIKVRLENGEYVSIDEKLEQFRYVPKHVYSLTQI